jgi:hypothetical protein
MIGLGGTIDDLLELVSWYWWRGHWILFFKPLNGFPVS